ncbi:hypothetical protein CHLRE_17g741050v5 [Chlamydomonas reinhardtii]|uniref:Uncharacterized protein n=1 Tax=Chlamydomonas reinhardtii TaxID=3055 RepID=A8JE84_CHLRE|nr:uncharacterized protein CHLRE_17g741050v5 [Chlamydomonas reinhardtii]PNW70972.1 hypothetical protein CHLRE_17g741050v5 [Chlamydomonas reinhardtii]|eukprot:XP_001701109.1 integral membrane protein [Chlamydomonas reinhardtii]
MPSPGSIDVEAVQASARLLPEADSSKPTEIHRLSSGTGRQRAASGAQALTSIVHSWASRKFAVGCAILFPVAVTVYVTWWFLTFFDNFFSPIYYKLFDFHVFGLGFITSMSFIFLIGVFFSSWLGSALLGIGEWIIKRLPLVKHIYSASKQVSAAINPENEASKAFQECVIIRHPRKGEYAIAFITGRTVLQMGSQDTKLNTVYVPTNHVYVGDIFLLEDKDVMHTNLSVREGLEIVVSCGMAIPPNLVTVPRP